MLATYLCEWASRAVDQAEPWKSARVVQPATLVVLFGLRADQDAVVETLQ